MPQLPPDTPLPLSLPKAAPDSYSNPTNPHPLHSLRKLQILTASLSIILFLFCYAPWRYDFLQGTMTVLFMSIFFGMYDLLIFAKNPPSSVSREGENGSWWPRRAILIGDAIFMVVLQMCFWGSVVDVAGPYQGIAFVVTAGILGTGFCSLIHACCFWKELKAWYKAKWLAEMAKEPCARCGYFAETTITSSTPLLRRQQQQQQQQPPNLVPYAGPSAYCHQAGVLFTPEESLESAMEEGLLDMSSRLGSEAEEAEIVVDVEEVVVQKGKKKKEDTKKKGRKADGGSEDMSGES